MRRKIIALLLAVLFCITCVSCQSEESESSVPTEESNVLEIVTFSIGKADAILISVGGKHALIDTGEKDDAQTIVRELRNRGVEELDMMIITHFDKDHVGSAATLLNYFSVGQIYYPDYEGTRSEYEDFMEAVSNTEHADAVTEILTFSFAGSEWSIYPPESTLVVDDSEDEYDNNLSLVCKVVFQNTSFLFAGDIEKDRIKQMLKTDVDWSADWLKMPHHGEYQKSLKDLLYVVSPQYTVITCSESEPTDSQLTEYLESRSISAFETTYQNVVTVSDGTTITVQYE